MEALEDVSNHISMCINSYSRLIWVGTFVCHYDCFKCGIISYIPCNGVTDDSTRKYDSLTILYYIAIAT